MECLKEKIELETNNMNRNIGHFIEAQTDLRRVTKTNSKGWELWSACIFTQYFEQMEELLC